MPHSFRNNPFFNYLAEITRPRERAILEPCVWATSQWKVTTRRVLLSLFRPIASKQYPDYRSSKLADMTLDAEDRVMDLAFSIAVLHQDWHQSQDKLPPELHHVMRGRFHVRLLM